MTQTEWLMMGIRNGWCSPPVCATHDGVPETVDEALAFEEGSDPCIQVIRPYESKEVRDAVESYHMPSVWRKPQWMK